MTKKDYKLTTEQLKSFELLMIKRGIALNVADKIIKELEKG